MQLVKASLAHSTRKSYLNSFCHYLNFLSSVHSPFPARSIFVAYYVVALHNQGLAASSVSSRLSAVAFIHKLLSINDPTKSFLVQRALQGLKHISGSWDTRLPITVHILQRLIQTLPRVTSSHYDLALYSAMFSLCFHAFLRVGEVTFTHKHSQHHILCFGALTFKSDQSFVISMSSYKHSHGRTHRITIHPSPGSSACPVETMHRYLSIRGNRPGYLFLSSTGTPVSCSQFASTLQSTLAFCRFPSSIKCHSFRIGAATHAAASGLSDSQIRYLGRWRSNAFLRYIR